VTAPAGWPHRLPRALYPLDSPPAGPGWNLPDLADLLPPEPLRPAAVLVGVVERPHGAQVLLTRRHEQLRHHAGQISFPGGRIEAADAGPVAAALREALEEVGLRPEHAEPLGFLDPFVTITGFHVMPVVARIDPGFAPVPDPNEVDEVFEAPLGFLLDPGNERHFEAEFAGRVRRIVEMRYGAYRIWGATAAMLVNFRRRLEDAA
jgi:8-oxo-dGTP pyrophosphatase MutT (NUDIX family)